MPRSARGRVGTGASDLLAEMGLPVTRWGSADTSHGGPFPEIMAHDLFLNCIFARPGSPVFVPHAALGGPRRLTVIGDVACDPDGQVKYLLGPTRIQGSSIADASSGPATNAPARTVKPMASP